MRTNQENMFIVCVNGEMAYTTAYESAEFKLVKARLLLNPFSENIHLHIEDIPTAQETRSGRSNYQKTELYTISKECDTIKIDFIVHNNA